MNLSIFSRVSYTLLITLFASCSQNTGTNTPPAQSKISAQLLSKTVAPFIKNDGQLTPDVHYYAHTFTGSVALTDAGIVYAIPLLDNTDSGLKTSTKGIALRESFVNPENKLSPRGEMESAAHVNILKGASETWKSNLPTYNQVILGTPWNGISTSVISKGNSVEKIFTIEAHRDPSKINLTFDGAKNISVDPIDNELIVATDLGDIRFSKPVAFQNINGSKVDVPVTYALKKDSLSYGFELGNYNNAYPLIIDPVLASTFIGAVGYEDIYGLAINSSGNIYITGYTLSNVFPVTSGVYDTSFSGGVRDAYVSKLSADLTTLLASTYIGGSNDDDGYSITIDGSGNVIITGQTTSSDFPTTVGAYDRTYNNADGFIAKLDSNLTTLIASTFVGGTGSDLVRSLAIDGSGNFFVTGYTTSVDFPTTGGAYDTSKDLGSSYDSFVSKFNSTLTSLSASTYIGGSSDDYAYGVVIGTGDVPIIAGDTSSSNFPIAGSPFSGTFSGGGGDAFISKLSSDLTSLSASTYLGGNGYDTVSLPIIDSTGNIAIAGYTSSSNYPTTSGVFDTSFGGDNDGTITILNQNLTSVVAATYIGGSGLDYLFSIAKDSNGNLIATGYSASSDFPTTSDAYSQTYIGGISDITISSFNSTLTSLNSSTYLGGTSADSARSIALDTADNMYVAGYSTSSNFPTSTGAYDTSYAGDPDGIVVKFSFVASTPTPTPTPDTSATPTPTPTVIPTLAAPRVSVIRRTAKLTVPQSARISTAQYKYTVRSRGFRKSIRTSRSSVNFNGLARGTYTGSYSRSADAATAQSAKKTFKISQ